MKLGVLIWGQTLEAKMDRQNYEIIWFNEVSVIIEWTKRCKLHIAFANERDKLFMTEW